MNKESISIITPEECINSYTKEEVDAYYESLFIKHRNIIEGFNKSLQRLKPTNYSWSWTNYQMSLSSIDKKEVCFLLEMAGWINVKIERVETEGALYPGGNITKISGIKISYEFPEKEVTVETKKRDLLSYINYLKNER